MGGFVCEGHQEDILRGYPAFQDIGEPVYQGPGLAAPGTRQDKTGAFRFRNNVILLRVQVVFVVYFIIIYKRYRRYGPYP